MGSCSSLDFAAMCLGPLRWGAMGRFMRLLGSEDVRREVAGIGRRAAESEERTAG